MSDPSPVITPFRVFTFLAALVVALAQLDVIPPEIKPWLIAAGVVINLALAIFFGTPTNPSVVNRVRGVKPAVK